MAIKGLRDSKTKKEMRGGLGAGGQIEALDLSVKLGVSQPILFKSTKVLMATPQGRRLGYYTPEQVSNQEPPDSRPD